MEITIVIIIALLVMLLVVVGIVGLISLLSFKEISLIPVIEARLRKAESIVEETLNTVNMNQVEDGFHDALKQVSESSGKKVVYRSIDGKHTADTPEELFKKMANDATTAINPHDLDALKNFFKQISTEVENMNFDMDNDDEQGKV